jgi:XTP/dITP diphosphohydrolase
MITLLLGTRNKHKISEIRSILGQNLRCASLDDFPEAPTVREDAATFRGNAAKKGIELAKWLAQRHHDAAQFVLADDSGLEVDALNGAPGVHSARFASLGRQGDGNASDADNNAKLLRLLRDVPIARRTARFRCVLALTPVLAAPMEISSPVCYSDELELQTEFFEGQCEGTIGLTPSGDHGFGYDPLFLPTGQSRTFADLPSELKNQISHRSQALEKLRLRLHKTLRA